MAILILGADGKPLPQYKKQGQDIMEAWEGKNGAGLFAADDGMIETLGNKNDTPADINNLTANATVISILKAMAKPKAWKVIWEYNHLNTDPIDVANGNILDTIASSTKGVMIVIDYTEKPAAGGNLAFTLQRSFKSDFSQPFSVTGSSLSDIGQWSYSSGPGVSAYAGNGASFSGYLGPYFRLKMNYSTDPSLTVGFGYSIKVYGFN
ncbi:MAG: hypothetical protein K0R54_4830 [Clostridiaceae bacterium]|jgi:hypothetical protein|nr:hypothetical protein [Clostridiaceae bacterium]